MAGQGTWGPHSLGYVAHTMALRRGGGSSISLACGSFVVEAQNFVEVITTDLDSLQARGTARLPHYYPPTRVRWLSQGPDGPDLLATSGDCLRVWSPGGELRSLMRHEANPQDRCTPITSVDACAAAAGGGGAQLVSCDVYGICALWDTERGVKQQAIDLGQPLSDVGYGPDGLVAVSGDQGDCFLVDPRQPQDVEVLTPAQRVGGPARVAWSPRQGGLLAAAWQGEGGGVALYGGSQSRLAAPQLIRGGAVVADLQWSPAFPELLCCVTEEGSVEVSEYPQGGAGSAPAATGPCFVWEPKGRGEACTAVALTDEVRPGMHAVVVATATSGPPTPQGQPAAALGGSLWMAALPQPSGRGVGGRGARRPAPAAPSEASGAEAPSSAWPARGVPCEG